ncbi:hypothetical protein BC937DRAFT_90923 [Endogone sp. FLAS-F59071]|nr:hypothetical protein BC937DRAFT_90923 [Endogone sp. FLAS-F59071]|eukprot:RUS21944.1 hypothetical protein BC937DRAFT_90923 [Endogone sp. FLAS-F59071]
MGKENIMLPNSDYGTVPRSAHVSPAPPAYNRVYFDGNRSLHRLLIQPSKTSWLRVTLAIWMSLLVLTTFSIMFTTYTDKEGVMITRHGLTYEEAESLVLSIPNSVSLHNTLKYYTSTAHVAGTRNDYLQAVWTRDKFIEYGIADTTIEEYWPMLNYPKYRRVAIVEPEYLKFEAKLREDKVDEDKTSGDQDAVPTFHGYSASGNVTGPIIYVNYGRLSEFEYLASLGVDFTGSIALVRYGAVFRGLKVRAAEKFGCIGVLIYSDPADDGPINKPGDEGHNQSYPEGPWRSPSSVQRGSVLYLPILPGDPLTPGYAATRSAPRIPRNETAALPTIPSLPISWEDALPLFKSLEGNGLPADEMPKGWRGGLDVNYFTGPSWAQINLVNQQEEKITAIWNVIGRIEGKEEKDRVVVLGNHRDAWVYGAVDPSSGSATLMELAKTLSILLQKGWRPRRTIILASWDAEEYGLVGSTEWVEDHASWLKDQAVTYINVDTAVSGPNFNVEATPSLARLLFDVTNLVTDPRTGKSVYNAWRTRSAHKRVDNAYEISEAVKDMNEPLIGQLGSGSDFVAFLDHIGVASISMAFAGEYGVYHSNYDSLHWMEKFGDPEFQYHKALTQIWGLLALRLSSLPILPIFPIRYASELSSYVDDITRSAPPAISNDSIPARDLALKFRLLHSAIASLCGAAEGAEDEANHLSKKLSKHGKHESRLERQLRQLNDRLAKFERGFLDEQGLEGREWFKHVVFAPGLWAGYDAQTFPGLAEKVQAGKWEEVQVAERRIAGLVKDAGRLLEGRSIVNENEEEKV